MGGGGEFLITAEVWMCVCGGGKVVVVVGVSKESLKVESAKQMSNHSRSKPP